MGLVEGDPEAGKYLGAFREALRALGWSDGQNLQIDFRAAADVEGLRSRAADLISLGPELIVTYTTPATNAVRQQTHSVPILFVAAVISPDSPISKPPWAASGSS
jgi:putative ABC transport system substrate-binding protein